VDSIDSYAYASMRIHAVFQLEEAVIWNDRSTNYQGLNWISCVYCTTASVTHIIKV